MIRLRVFSSSINQPQPPEGEVQKNQLISHLARVCEEPVSHSISKLVLDVSQGPDSQTMWVSFCMCSARETPGKRGWQ